MENFYQGDPSLFSFFFSSAILTRYCDNGTRDIRRASVTLSLIAALFTPWWAGILRSPRRYLLVFEFMICKCAFVYNAEGEQREISKRAKFFLPKLIVSSKLFFFEKIKNRKINSIHFLLYNNSCIKRKLVFTVAINSPIFKVRRDVKYDRFKILTQYRGVIRPRHPHTTDSSILAPGYSSNPDAAKKCCASTKAGIYISNTPDTTPFPFTLHPFNLSPRDSSRWNF